MPQRATFYLLLETSRAFTREIFRGVTRWSNLYGPATLVVSAGHVDQELPKRRSLQNAGIIARLPTPGVLDAVKNLGVPVVTIEPSLPEYEKIKRELGVSEILSDSDAVGRLGVKHFSERAFRRFAFCGLPRRIWSAKRQEAFVRRARNLGETFVYDYPLDESVTLSRQEERPYLTDWLKRLPKPIGVMACNDDRAAELLEICQFEGIDVPDRVAVLGVDNDDLLCELTTPPLSSVTFDLNRTGFRAAALLWDLISGTASGYHCIDLVPTGITARRSTEVVAEEDRLVQRAVRFIRDNYQRQIDVAAIARSLDVSRRTLERRFSQVLHRSVRDQIELFRLEQAQNLLTHTADTVEAIARNSGFTHLKPMVRVFQERTGCNPTEYRKKSSES